MLWPRTAPERRPLKKYRRVALPPAALALFLYFMKASMSTTMRFPVVTYVQCKPVLHTDMVTMAQRELPLFSFRVQHLHEERLRWGTAVAVFLIQVLLATRGQRVDFWQQLQHFVELILKEKAFSNTPYLR